MNVYIQGLSALAFYRSPDARLEVERTPARIRTLDGATSSLREIAELDIWKLGIGEPSAEQPLEVLIGPNDKRIRSKAIKPRVWKGAISPTAFRQVGKSIFVSSPEFTFLQLATRLELPELIALGMELCGTYRRNVEVGSAEYGHTSRITVYHLQPLSTPKRLRGFLNTMGSAPGSPNAQKALNYVLPNSASPMETALYLLLCLPRKYGGYALPKPELNPPIVLSKAGRRHTLRSRAMPDLYWKSKKLDLEFNSDEFHDESNRASDSMRRKALERMRVEVLELTTVELHDVGLFHATVQRIARRLGKQLRPEHEGSFIEDRRLLRGHLLFDTKTEGRSAESTAAPEDSPWGSTEDGWAGEQLSAWADEPSSEAWGSVDDEWFYDLANSEEAWDADIPSWDDNALESEASEPDWDDNLHVYGESGWERGTSQT